MRLDYHKNPVTRERVYVVRIGEFEWPNMHRYGDQPLMDDCSGPDSAIADKLLGLQQVAFRIEQENGQK